MTASKRWARLAWPAALAGGLSLAFGLAMCWSRAQDTPIQPKASAAAPAKPADPKAKALLAEVAKAYKGLNSYTDEGQFVMAMTIGGKPQKQTIPLKLTFVRPNKMDFDAGPVRLVSDGKTLTTTVIPLKRYTSTPAPGEINFETFRQGPTGAVLFGGPSGAPMFVLLNLLTSPDPAAALGQLGGSLQLAPEDPKAAASGAQALLIDQQEGPDIRLDVDPATKLLSRIEFQIDPKTLSKSDPAGQSISIEQFGWTSGAVNTQVAKDRSFAYEVPKGFAKVDSLLEQPGGGEEPKFAVNEMLNKPAPDFTLTVLDGPDKTRTVTKAELAGKVVLIDFWATWCGPCRAEIPNIKDNYEKHQREGFEVIGISLDQMSGRELAEFVKKEEVPWTICRDADSSQSMAAYYGIQGIPQMILVGRDGTVITLNARGSALGPMVEKALGAAGSTARVADDEGRAKVKKEKDRNKAVELAALKEKREQAAAKAKAVQPRTWTDASGKFHVTAKFRGMANKVVKLEREDGSVISLPLEKLSDDDQECIRERKY